MLELDKKLLDQFQGYVVRKDVVRSVKGGANVPVFVLEYLLANSCSTDDEQKIKEGVENVKNVLRKHYVNPDEANLIQAKIREEGTYKVIDKISVRLDASNFLATHGPTKTIFAFGDAILAALAVATIGVSALEISSITSGKYFFPSIDHDGQHDVSKNGSFPVATL